MGREVPRRIRDRCVQLLSTGHGVQDIVPIIALEFPDDEPASARFVQRLAKELGVGRAPGKQPGVLDEKRRDEARAAYAKWGSYRAAGEHMDPPISGAAVHKLLKPTVAK